MNELDEELSQALEQLRWMLKASTLSQEEKLAEVNGLIHRLRQPKSNRGKRPSPEVPMADLMIALQYLRQPVDLEGKPEKSVEMLVNEAIKFKGFDGNIETSIHARRIRRLIERIEQNGWRPLGERIQAMIEADDLSTE